MHRNGNLIGFLALILAGVTATQDAVHADPILFTYSVSVTPETLGQPDALVRLAPVAAGGPIDGSTTSWVNLFVATVEPLGGTVSFDPPVPQDVNLTITDIASGEFIVVPMTFMYSGDISGSTWDLFGYPDVAYSDAIVLGGNRYVWSTFGLAQASLIHLYSPNVSSSPARIGITVDNGNDQGACCLEHGQCVMRTEPDCFGQIFGGSGTNCSEVTCVPFIPCCVFDVGCLPITAEECAQLGGIEDPASFGCSDPDHSCHGDFPPIFQAASVPFNTSRTRYVSFHVPWGYLMAIRVRRTSPPPTIDMGWLDFPDTEGNVSIVPQPVFGYWPISIAGKTLHISGCDVMPGAIYEIAPTQGFNNGWFPISVLTVPKPAGKDWGDLVGPFNGTAWPAPDGLANVNDVLAVLAFIRQAPGAPDFTVVNVQAQSANDPCLNDFVNVGDLFAIVKAVGGAAYPFTTDPSQCPPCP